MTKISQTNTNLGNYYMISPNDDTDNKNNSNNKGDYDNDNYDNDNCIVIMITITVTVATITKPTKARKTKRTTRTIIMWIYNVQTYTTHGWSSCRVSQCMWWPKMMEWNYSFILQLHLPIDHGLLVTELGVSIVSQKLLQQRSDEVISSDLHMRAFWSWIF